jgi:hypothetical protein
MQNSKQNPDKLISAMYILKYNTNVTLPQKREKEMEMLRQSNINGVNFIKLHYMHVVNITINLCAIKNN